MKKSLLSATLVAALGFGAWSAAAQGQPPAPPEKPAGLSAKQTESGGEQLKHASALATSQAKLALSLIEQLSRRGEENTAVSPASLDAAFALVGEGADEALKTAIAKVLGFEAGDAKRSLALILDARAKLKAGAGGPFQSADRIVLAPGVEPSPDLIERLKKRDAAPEVKDLTKPEVVAEINEWVKNETQGAIPEILGQPTEKPAFVTLNALHFKGKWKTPFDAKLTAPAPFKSADGKSSDVEMMRLTEARRLYRTDKKFVAVDLPFSDERFSLVVVTTTDKPAQVRDFAKLGEWLIGAGFSQRKGDLALPRFKLSDRYELTPTLDALGLEKARRSPAALADFGKGAMLSQVVQRTEIEVDEEGAEAAAATAIMATRALQQGPEDVVRMVVDKPFVFALREKESGLILIAGYVGRAPLGK